MARIDILWQQLETAQANLARAHERRNFELSGEISLEIADIKRAIEEEAQRDRARPPSDLEIRVQDENGERWVPLHEIDINDLLNIVVTRRERT